MPDAALEMIALRSTQRKATIDKGEQAVHGTALYTPLGGASLRDCAVLACSREFLEDAIASLVHS